MKKILFLFLLPAKLFAQTTDSTSTTKIAEPIYTKAEKVAVFAGGVKAWEAYLKSNLDSTLASKYLSRVKEWW